MENRNRYIWSRIRHWIDNKLTANIWVQLGLFAGVFLMALLLLWLLYALTGAGGLRQTLADIFGPDQFINYAYPDDGNTSATPTVVLIASVVACLVGAIIFQGLLIATITNIIQTRADKVKDGDVDYQFENHYLILGYNDKTVALIQSFNGLDDTTPDIVIAVEKGVPALREELEVQLDKVLFEHVTLLHANRTREEDLQHLCVAQAKRIYIIGEESESNHDLRNMECYNKISQHNDKIDCFVYLQKQDFFNLVAQYGPNDIEHFHMFNYEELWSRKVLVDVNDDYGSMAKLDYRSEDDNIAKCPEKQVHLVVMGMTEMGEALAREAAFVAHYRNFITHGKRTKITCVDPDMKRKMKSFLGRHQTFFQHCRYICRWWDEVGEMKTCQNTIDEKNDFLDIEFEFIEADVMDYHVLQLLKDWGNDTAGQFLNIAFCQDDMEANFRNSHRLPTEVYISQTPIWVYADNTINSSVLEHDRFRAIHYFGGPNISIEENAIELQWAKYVNWIYAYLYDKKISQDVIQTKIDKKEYEKEANDKWATLKIDKRWSNLYNALSLPFKLRSIGAVYADDKIVNANLTPEVVELLGEVEHNRWNAEQLLLGYRQKKDEDEYKDEKEAKANFIHPDICPNAKLKEYTKDKDRKLLTYLIDAINREGGAAVRHS